MPEGSEVRVVADQIQKKCEIIFNSARVIENVQGILHRYSRENPKNWDKLQQKWILKQVRTKGKLIFFDIVIHQTGEKWVGLSTLGMSGDWRFNSSDHKHCRFSFINNYGDLSLIDQRCFATWRLVTPKRAVEIKNKIGHDLLQSPMPVRQWSAIQHYPKLRNKPIGEILLGQSIFSGIGNIYKCETMYEVRVDPKILVKDISEDTWQLINPIAHKILKMAYLAGGSSVKDFTANGVEGKAQTLLKVYGKDKCPKGHKISTVKQGKGSNRRTSWFCKTCLE